MAATSSSPATQLNLRNGNVSLNRVGASLVNHQLNLIPSVRRSGRVVRGYVCRRFNVTDRSLFGKSLVDSSRLFQLKNGKKVRIGVTASFSGVPEKSMGLYNPEYDKDSCGVGFVGELSGEASRKTVCMCIVFV